MARVSRAIPEYTENLERCAIPEYTESLERYAIIEYIDGLYERLTYLLYSRFQKQRRTAGGTPSSGED